MERLHPPLTEDEQKVAQLPDNVQDYLAQVGIARNEAMPGRARADAMHRQIVLLSEMTEDDRLVMGIYIDWKTAGLRLKAETNGNHRPPIIPKGN